MYRDEFIKGKYGGRKCLQAKDMWSITERRMEQRPSLNGLSL